MMLDTFLHNLQGIYYTLIPKNPSYLLKYFSKLSDKKLLEIKARLQYYCNATFDIPIPQKTTKKIQMLRNHSRYCYDFWESMRHFNPNLAFHLETGDVNYQTPFPSFCKSRPISSKSSNNILLKLDKKRHFQTLETLNAQKHNNNLQIPSFENKINQVFFRGGCYQENRKRFMTHFFDHPLVNAGHVGSLGTPLLQSWFKGKANLATHLKYKFILSLEGNDVATNLKWIMASNSLAIMPKPKFETWFMEGTLIPDFHYLSIDDNFENLEEKIEYILQNPTFAKEIISNANHYTENFMDKPMEKLLNYLVVKKYFYKSGQIEVSNLEEELFV